MSERIGTGRLTLYVALLAALVGANLWYWLPGEPAQGTTARTAPAATVRALPDLIATQQFHGFAGPMQRDLFAAPAPAPVIVAPPPPPPPPQPQDPAELARQQVQKTFDSFVVLGILGSGNGPVAVIEAGGQVLSLSTGDAVLPGYEVKAITLDFVQLVHKDTGLERTYQVTGTGN